MAATRLSTIRVEKPWGRRDLWPGFEHPGANEGPIGEIWFDAPDGQDPDLLVKYLFTSERLSVQVHPNDAQAQARGHARGKDEAWLVLAAETDSTIALGTVRPIGHDELRAAALDGSIETLMDWKPVKAGDFIYSAANTVHAIGAGITLIEVQQNVDLTYRLYDYGRPRELHLEDGVAVSEAVPFVVPPIAGEKSPGRRILADTDKFVLERWQFSGPRHLALAAPGWLVPVSGAGMIGDSPFVAGECWMLEGEVHFTVAPESDVLFASALPFTLSE